MFSIVFSCFFLSFLSFFWLRRLLSSRNRPTHAEAATSFLRSCWDAADNRRCRSLCLLSIFQIVFFPLFHGGLIIYVNRHFGYALIFPFFFSLHAAATNVDEIRRVSRKLTLNICADIIYSRTNDDGGDVSRRSKEEVKEKKKFSVHSDPDISSQRRRQFVYFRNSFEIEFKALFGREDSFVSDENFFFSAIWQEWREKMSQNSILKSISR